MCLCYVVILTENCKQAYSQWLSIFCPSLKVFFSWRLEHFSLLPYNVTCNCNSKVNDFPSAADSSWQLLKILLGFTEPLCCHIHIFTSCFSEIHYATFTHTYSKWFFSWGTKTKSKLMKAMVVAEQYCHVRICSNMLLTTNHIFRLNFKVLYVCVC